MAKKYEFVVNYRSGRQERLVTGSGLKARNIRQDLAQALRLGVVVGWEEVDQAAEKRA